MIFVKAGKTFISVRDFGMGIDNEKQGKTFDRFERAVSSSNISGLGLGSTFTVTLPLKA